MASTNADFLGRLGRNGRQAIKTAAVVTTMLIVACMPGRSVVTGDLPSEISGKLDGALLNGSDECVWLDGQAGERTYLLLPPAIKAKFEPLTLADTAGSTIARAGDLVTVIGVAGRAGFTSCDPEANPFRVDAIASLAPA